MRPGVPPTPRTTSTSPWGSDVADQHTRNVEMTEEILRHLPSPDITTHQSVSFRPDGENTIICERYDEDGLMVTDVHRIRIESEPIEGAE